MVDMDEIRLPDLILKYCIAWRADGILRVTCIAWIWIGKREAKS